MLPGQLSGTRYSYQVSILVLATCQLHADVCCLVIPPGQSKVQRLPIKLLVMPGSGAPEDHSAFRSELMGLLGIMLTFFTISRKSEEQPQGFSR